MRRVSLQLPNALYARLRARAKQQKRNKATLVKDALEAYLVGGNGAAGASCFEQAKDVWGSLEGPGDLSHNPKHLQGYGS